LGALAAFALASCAPIYVPNQVNVPMIREQGDANLSVGMSLAGFEIQGAAGVAKNIGVMANASFAVEDSSNADSYRDGNLVEFGVGYLSGEGENLRAEFYGGYGVGSSEAENTFGENAAETTTYVESDYGRLFLQSNLGFVSSFLESALSLRFSYVSFKEPSESQLFLEPAATARVGFEAVKLQAQLGFSIPVGEAPFDHEPVIFGLGINFRLDDLF
jgi:hypothetical protein